MGSSGGSPSRGSTSGNYEGRRISLELKPAQMIAARVVERLRPYCSRIEIVGSIRRRKLLVNDIDLVVIPPDLWGLNAELPRLGRVTMSGGKIQRIKTGVVTIDLYIASEDNWATLLLIRTGSKDNNVRLCSLAKAKGWRLAATGDGLFNEKGERIAGDSEQSIYAALGLKYQEPWERE